MNKNYVLYAVAALFALLGTNVQADIFDIARRPEERAVPGGEVRPTAFPGIVEEETESGMTPRVEPLEWLTGGRHAERRDYRDDRRSNRTYDYYE